jgi:hypothetical protein
MNDEAKRKDGEALAGLFDQGSIEVNPLEFQSGTPPRLRTFLRRLGIPGPEGEASEARNTDGLGAADAEFLRANPEAEKAFREEFEARTAELNRERERERNAAQVHGAHDARNRARALARKAAEQRAKAGA